MSADPRAALSVLVSAFERHLEACAARRGEDDPTVLAAYDDLVEAFEAYDGALYDATGEMTPFDIYGTDDDLDEGEDDDDEGDLDELGEDEEIDDHGDEDGDEQLYAGLDDADFDDERG
jgi:hypothetical protein